MRCTRKAMVLGLSGALLVGGWSMTPMAWGDAVDASAEPTRRQVPGPGSSFGRDDGSALRGDAFEGYDFGQVVQRLETSVDPLQREMDASFRSFTESVREATQKLEEGQTKQAIELSRSAIEGLLEVRDEVTGPMWEGQAYLTEQIGQVRDRLARAVSAGDADGVQLDERTERTLDGLASRIADEDDELRRQRLVAHYRTVRNMAQIRRLADRMSPDQRQLWSSVLRVLDEAALTHQQVLMGSEVLFAQLEATAENLDEYVALLDTVDGASRLLGAVHGADGDDSGLAAFARNMQQLQQHLTGFSSAVETSLEASMHELEAQIDAVEPMEDFDPVGGAIDGATGMDDELAARIDRIRDE